MSRKSRHSIALNGIKSEPEYTTLRPIPTNTPATRTVDQHPPSPARSSVESGTARTVATQVFHRSDARKYNHALFIDSRSMKNFVNIRRS
jgi:hypothetical protein